MKAASTAYTSSTCGVSSSSSPSFSRSVGIGLGAVSEWRDELPRHVNGVSESTSGVRSRPNSSCITIGQYKKLGDGLVKPNEILTEVAPPLINISAALGENTWHLNLEQEIHEN
jgi:hypothetical protein